MRSVQRIRPCAGLPSTPVKSRPFNKLRSINLLDFVILVAIVFAAGNGHQRGFWLSLFQYLGLLGGVLVGAALAPVVADLLGIQGSVTRPLTAALVLLVLGSVGSRLGYWLWGPTPFPVL